MLNSIAIDADGEDYDFKSFQFAGVSDIVDATCNYAVGVSGERVIPVASSTVIGGVRVCEGSGLTVGTNGELSIDGNSLADRISATDDEVQEVVNQYFDNN